ncbi:unnamed protein product [Rotaria magnacalcarata]|uniref:G-protein coupled receptors family 1 profile domain-containing protein n=3 Tax=Rotaria magnacalcarata TaxID=392030 RepID=A0A817A2B6_9BILA|nr:unnamed protein product [Rotaria magnacalcarata]CAF2244875.1 unnamed protein product [Rotaria magnacalcarata]CAF4044487.1 unnamed protein product [Rotaria magnacalcarata]
MSQFLATVRHVNIYVQPVYLSLAIIFNLLNIRILSSRTLRSSPCTHYFIANAIFNIIYASLVCPINVARGFSIDWTLNPIGCKMQTYFVFLSPILAKAMLVLASFDRYCSSSQLHRLSSQSTIRTARIIIIITTISGTIYEIPMFLMYRFKESTRTCLPDTNAFNNIYVFSQVTLYYIAAPLSMIVFGILTISNTKKQMARIGPEVNSGRGRPTESQLTRMLLLQVTVHLVLTVPYGVTYSMNVFDPSTVTNYIQAIRYAMLIWQECDFFSSFFLYILAGSAYRKEFMRILPFTRPQNHTTPEFINPQIKTIQQNSAKTNTLSLAARRN